VSVGIPQKNAFMRTKIKFISVVGSKKWKTGTTKGFKKGIVRIFLKQNSIRYFEI
jgi:hypothetical protein